MSKHTPGPWTAYHYGIRDVGGYIVALNWPTRYEGQEQRYIKELSEREADARLIAAAPELLEACQVARSAIVLGNGREIDWNAIADQLQIAIAKATQP